MKCKWYAEFEGVCCNGDCKAHCADSCPFDGYSEDCKHGEEKKPTNFDRIKAMSVEEMAEYIVCNEKPCLYCVYNGTDHSNGYDCREGVQKWLESEV